ncbi:hypothetical protein MBLNU457_5446t1 [Dothideomycetes sp. NU457]
MSGYHYAAQHYPSTMQSHSSHPHNHHGRRRGPRVSAAQNSHRQQMFKAQRSPKEVTNNPASNAYAKDYENARSFEFEDDEIFCPFHLLTHDDLNSIHSSSSSDRSSLSSGSPEASPVQHQLQPTPSFVLSTPSNFNQASFNHNTVASQQRMKLHQPMAQRTRNAIPIVDPSTRSGVASPAPSLSPPRQMQASLPRRW